MLTIILWSLHLQMEKNQFSLPTMQSSIPYLEESQNNEKPPQ